MRKKKEPEAPGPEAKVKLSRVKRRRDEETRKKRRLLISAALVVGLVLALGAALDIPYINLARVAGGKLGELMSSSRGEGGEQMAQPQYLFLTHPQNGRRLEGDVTALVALYTDTAKGEEGRTVLGLALFTYSIPSGQGEVYIIPEDSVAFNAAGQATDLRRALREEQGGDLLSSTVGNLSGEEVDYLVMVEFWDAVRICQKTAPPPVVMVEDTVLVNPLNGETNFLARGQEVRDADRLLMWLLGTDELDRREAYALRGERARLYLQEYRADVGVGIEGVLLGEADPDAEGLEMRPSTGSRRGDWDYLASMFQAFMELGENDLTVMAVPRVEVLNGCGVPDLGKKLGERLASLGVPLAGTGGNAKVTVEGEEVNDFSHEESVIIYRSDAVRVAAYARYLGVLLAVKEVRFEAGPGPEVVLIAGRDMAGR